MNIKEFIEKVRQGSNLEVYSPSHVSKKLPQYHGECLNHIFEISETLIELYKQRDIEFGKRYKHYTEDYSFSLSTKTDKETYTNSEIEIAELNKKIKLEENKLSALENVIKFINGIRNDINNIITYEKNIKL